MSSAESSAPEARGAGLQSDLEHAAGLIGAAASLRQGTGAPEQPNDAVLAYLNEVTNDARAELGATKRSRRRSDAGARVPPMSSTKSSRTSQ